MSVPGDANKLRAVFWGPGWVPGTPRLGDYQQLPQVSHCSYHKSNINVSSVMVFLFDCDVENGAR